MKLILVFVTIIGFTRSEVDDVAVARAFIKCIDKALDGGLPSVPIPNHNPLVIRDLVYNSSALLTEFTLGITNNVLYNLLDYNFTKIEATEYTDPARVAYDYDLYWPKLNFTGDYEIEFHTPLFGEDIVGTYSIVLREIDWTGIFNLTKRGQEAQGFSEHVDDFTIASKVQDADITVTGTAVTEIVEEALKTTLLAVMNNFPEIVGQALKNRFNDFWIAHPEKIDAIIENCTS